MSSPWQSSFLTLHHLLFVTLAFIIGISIQAWYNLLPCMGYSFVTILLICTVLGAFLKIGRKYLWLLLPLAFIAGGLQYQSKIAAHKEFYTTYTGPIEKIAGIVIEKEVLQHPFLKQRITLQLNDGSDANIHVFTPRKIYATVGDTLQLNAVSFTQSSNKEYDQFLTKEGIAAAVFLKGDHPYSIIERNKKTFPRKISNIRNRILWSLRKKLNKETFTLFTAIFLGYKYATKEDLANFKNLFKNWGILHYLARSGLHLVIIILLLQLLLRLVPCSFTLKQIFAVFFIVLYHLLSWSSTSFMRAIITFFLYSFCIIARWQCSFIHLLTITCFTTLLFNPLQLFFLDFQLSYGMTYALACLSFSRNHRT